MKSFVNSYLINMKLFFLIIITLIIVDLIAKQFILNETNKIKIRNLWAQNILSIRWSEILFDTGNGFGVGVYNFRIKVVAFLWRFNENVNFINTEYHSDPCCKELFFELNISLLLSVSKSPYLMKDTNIDCVL